MKRLVLMAMCLAALLFLGVTTAPAATSVKADSGPVVSAKAVGGGGGGGGPGLRVARCFWKTVCRPCRKVCKRYRVCRPFRCRMRCRSRIVIIRGRRSACITKRVGWRCVMLRSRPPRCRALARTVRVCKPCVNGICRFRVKDCRCYGRRICVLRTKCARICPRPRCRRVRVCR